MQGRGARVAGLVGGQGAKSLEGQTKVLCGFREHKAVIH